MIPLPFTLKVPGQDDVSGTGVHSTTYTFHGLLHFEGTTVRLEWTGTAAIDEVTGLDVHSRVLSLPREELEVPVEELRRIEARGGWWRPRLEVCARKLETLQTVPGEERGVVRLWLARRDRRAARECAALIRVAMATPALANTDSHPRVSRPKPGTADHPE